MQRLLNDDWLRSNTDQVCSNALLWSLCYNTSYTKLIIGPGGSLNPYMVDPGAIGVLREDTPYTDRQEALVHSYYITKSELFDRLYSHPQRDAIVKRVMASQHERTEIASGIQRIILSQTNPSMYGNVNLDLSGNPTYKAQVSEETIEMIELWFGMTRQKITKL